MCGIAALPGFVQPKVKVSPEEQSVVVFVKEKAGIPKLCYLLQLQLETDVGHSLTCDGKALVDLVALEIGNLGENMLLRRAVYLAAIDEHTQLGCYVHSAG